MLKGLFTWNWTLWYQLNTLLGITIMVMGTMLIYESVMFGGFMYGIIYGLLWFFSVAYK